jgi:hypothetical protein
VGPSEIGDISVGIEIKEPEVILPNGFTYPDGAKVVSGNATAIATAFNGGIFVADTSDATGATVTGTDYVYSQDGVDQVVWAGPGSANVTTATLGAISVPPGKTLFIGAPLVINAAATTGAVFSGISVSDQGTLPQTSIQYANVPGKGGAKIDDTTKGTLVILAGAEITNSGGTAGVFTVGGNLEIHQGGKVEFTGTAPLIKTTAGSSSTVFGVLSGIGVEIHGTLAIEGRGSVVTGNNAVFDDTVTINGLGTLATAGADFNGPVSVGSGAEVLLTNNSIDIGNEFALNGILTADAYGVNLLPTSTSHLKVGATAKITADDWNQFTYNSGNAANDVVLLAALNEDEPSLRNNHITITPTDETAIYLNVGTVEASTYPNLIFLAGHKSLHLEEIDYTAGPVPTAAQLAAEDLVVARHNAVVNLGLTVLGNVKVENGGALELTGAVTTAGKVEIIGNGRPAVNGLSAVATDLEDAVFGLSLGSLIIGDDDAETELVLTDATFASANNPNTVITVSKNAVLVLNPDVAVDPPNKIELIAGDAGKSNGGKLVFVDSTTSHAAAFTRLKELFIGLEASFTGYDDTDTALGSPAAINTISFAKLTKLTVNGRLDLPSNSANLFNLLQTDVSKTSNDVTGGGRAIFAGWDVTVLKNHAFDQILGIKDVTVNSITDIPRTSGLNPGDTPDRSTTTTTTVDDGYKLRVIGALNVPAGGLTIDRDLYLTTTTTSLISVVQPGAPITIAQDKKVYSLDGPVLQGTSKTVLNVVNGGSAANATTLAAGVKGALATGVTASTGTVTVAPGSILKVPGVLTASASTTIYAGRDDNLGLITLMAGSILTNGTIASGAANVNNHAAGTITVDESLIVGGASKVTGYYVDADENAQSSIVLNEGAYLETTASGTLVFGTTGANLTNSTKLLAEADTTLTVTSVDDVTVADESDLFVTKGTFVVPAAKTLTIEGKVTVLKGEVGYDYAAVEMAVIAGATLDAVNSAIDITAGTLDGKTGNSLLTKGEGILKIGTIATLKAPDEQTLPLLHATNGITAGTLNLEDGNELRILATNTLKVGTTTTLATLNVGTGRITFAQTGGKIEVQTDSSGGSNVTVPSHLIIGSFDFVSQKSDATNTVYVDFAGATKTDNTTSINQIFITGASGTATNAATSSTLSVAGNSGKPTLNGVAGAVITASSTTVHLGA